MLKKTRGIVINYTKYSETSIIAKIFTEEMGMKTYLVNGVRSNKNGSKIALYQPLTLLDMVVYFKQNNNSIQRISEARCHVPYHNIPFDFQKSTIALFIAEVLSKALREEEENLLLFDFLLNALVWFDDTQDDYQAFHLQFLAKMPRFLGFDPQSADVLIAEVSHQRPVSFPAERSTEVKGVVNQLLNSNFDQKISIGRSVRGYVIDLLLEYYHLHVGGFGTLKSLTVLREMMN